MRVLRRVGFPLALARARVARAPGRLALVAVGFAGAAATLAAVLAGSVVAQDRSVSRALQDVPEEARAVRAVWFGVPGEAGVHRRLDRQARGALAALGSREPVAAVLLRRTSIGGRLVDLAGIDGLGRWVALAAGRLPRPCRPERCEVLRLGGEGPVPRVPGLTLVVVGTGTLASEVVLGRFVDPDAYHQPATPPLLVAEGVDALADAPSLRSIYRSHAWVAPLAEGSVRAWETAGFGDRVAQMRSTLRAADPGFEVDAPAAEVERAGATARAAGRRLLVVGGEACALLVAFAALAAASLRRDVAAARRRLGWFGGRGWQSDVMTAAEVGIVALGGVVAGFACGAALAASIARAAGVPVAGVLRHSVVTPSGLAAVVVLSLGAVAVVFLAVRARPLHFGGLAISPLDVAALGSLLAVAVLVARGSADADALAREEGMGTALLLLPGLVAFAAAVASARLFAPCLRAVTRAAGRRSVPLRLAAFSLARRPGGASVAVAFLTVSLGLAVFALTYRSTLVRGQEDQAAYAVPVTAIVREDLEALVGPLELTPLERYGGLARGVQATPVIRLSGSAPRLSGARAVTILGVSAGELASLDGWREDFASRPLPELRGLVEPARPAGLRGPALPPDARELRLAARLKGSPVGVAANVLTTAGTFVTVPLGRTGGDSRPTLRAALPPEARGGRLIGLTLSPPRRVEEPGASAGRAARGVLTVERLDVLGERPTRLALEGWIAPNRSAGAVESGPRPRLHYALTNQVVSRFRPRQAADDGPVSVLATPGVAASAGERGILSVDLGGERLLASVAAVVDRFPTIEREGIVADRELLATALNADSPGSAEVSEVWLRAPPGEAPTLEAALARPPFAGLAVTTRADVEASLRGDPLARGALLTLAAAALVALALALVGVLLGVVGDLRDERGELFDLEAQGASPSDLRCHVRLRSAVVAAAGLAAGAVTGMLLTALVVDLVRLTAAAAPPEPPLVLSLDWPLVAVGFAAYATAVAALVSLATAHAFRAPVPGVRASELAA